MTARSKSIRNKLRPTVSQIAYHKESKEIMPGGEELLRTMFEAMEEGMVYIAPDGQIVITNPAAERILGLTHSEIEARNYTAPEWQILRPDGTPMPPEEMAGPRAMNEKRPVRNMVMGTKRPDGFISWINVSAIPLLDAASRLQGVLGIFTDITEKKQAEEEFRNSEEKLKLYLENSPIGMYSIDRNGTFLYGNKAAEKMTGYSREESIGKSFLEINLLAPEYLPKAAQLLAQNAAGRPTGPDELELIRKDGSLISVEISTYPIGEEDEIEIIGIARDITERKQAEEALRESEEKYRTILEGIEDGYYEVDIAGNFTFFNDPMCGIIGYSKDEMVGMNNRQYMDKENAKKVYQAFNRVYATGKNTKGFGWEIIRQDGTKRFIETSVSLRRNPEGEPTGFRGIVRDVTERKQAEEELLRKEEYYHALIENSSDAISVLDADGIMRYESPSYERMLGYRPEEEIGKSGFEYLHQDDMQRATSAFARLFQDPSVTVHEEVRVWHKDGSLHTIEVAAQNILDNPAIKGIVANYHDITERKQAEETLRIERDKFQALFDGLAQTEIGINIIGLDYKVQLQNQVLIDRFGDITGELCYEKYMGLKKPCDFCPMIKAIKNKKAESVELTAVDGSDYELVSAPLINMDGTVDKVIEVVRDITERKQVDDELRESEDRLRALIENAPEAIISYDLSGTILDTNKKAEELISYPREEFIGKNMFELGVIPDDYAPRTIKALAKAGEGAEALPFEFKLIRKDGSQITVEATTMAVERRGELEILCIARDITERQRMEESLRLKEDAIEYSLGAIAMSDMEGKITYVNKACMKLWGSDNKEDIVGKPYWKLLESLEAVPEKATKRMQEIKGTVTEDHFWNGELAGINKGGKKIHLYVTSSIVKDNDGNPIQTVSSFYDVTERKQAEEEKESIEQQLQLAGRLAAVGELSAGIAHELNNPLAAVQAFAQFLSERKDLDESTKSDVETIYKESQRATRITTNLLSFARKHKPEKGLISINEALEKSLELHAYRMGVNSIEISMELDQELPRTMADFYQLEQVFVNIITNAEQAMTEAHGGGKLLVKTQMVGELIQITFTDDGPGIPEENLKKIFDPFFTTKDVGKGTGLGLSICFGIVHEHGGRLYARSKSGEGATFVAEIPIVSEDKPIAQESH